MSLQVTDSSQYFGGNDNAKNNKFIDQGSVMAAFWKGNKIHYLLYAINSCWWLMISVNSSGSCLRS